MMLGLGSWDIALAFWLCILSSAGCVVYGILKWNDKGEPDKVRIERRIIPGKTAPRGPSEKTGETRSDES